MSFLRELRDAAKALPDSHLKNWLRRSADEIDALVKRLAVDVTAENMIELNGAWANACAALRQIPKTPEGGGAKQRLAA